MKSNILLFTAALLALMLFAVMDLSQSAKSAEGFNKNNNTFVSNNNNISSNSIETIDNYDVKGTAKVIIIDKLSRNAYPGDIFKVFDTTEQSGQFGNASQILEAYEN